MAIPVPEELKPRGSVRSAPPRRPGSVRRTATMDFTWPDGLAGDTVLDGRARDLRTDRRRHGDGRWPRPRCGMVTDPGRVIKEIGSAPEAARARRAWRASRRCPASAGGWPRPGRPSARRDAAVPAARRRPRGHPGLRRRLAALVRHGRLPGAQGRRQPARDDRRVHRLPAGLERAAAGRDPPLASGRQPAVDIDAVDDDLAWHSHPRPDGVTMRRARRIDVWADGPVIHVDAFFQDSSTLPEGGRQSIHEYTLTAAADLETGTVRAITPVARVLPYDECPLAVAQRRRPGRAAAERAARGGPRAAARAARLHPPQRHAAGAGRGARARPAAPCRLGTLGELRARAMPRSWPAPCPRRRAGRSCSAWSSCRRSASRPGSGRRCRGRGCPPPTRPAAAAAPWTAPPPRPPTRPR